MKEALILTQLESPPIKNRNNICYLTKMSWCYLTSLDLKNNSTSFKIWRTEITFIEYSERFHWIATFMYYDSVDNHFIIWGHEVRLPLDPTHDNPSLPKSNWIQETPSLLRGPLDLGIQSSYHRSNICLIKKRFLDLKIELVSNTWFLHIEWNFVRTQWKH